MSNPHGSVAPSDRKRDDEYTPREVRGVLKWFDQSKGYGFITPDDGSQDIMLHSSCLRSCGLETPEEGAAIICEAVERAKGLQAIRILRIEGGAPNMEKPQDDVGDLAGPMQLMVVKWFSRAKGYGFLQEESGGEDIFVHMETVRAGGFSQLEAGQRVNARIFRGPKGLMAKSVGPHKAH
ncbi:MAG: cold-shock protein [Parvularcula sp.]|jgi:CspA family cold shock protein|nr:cold-shock protein [Parvularcula sp.]